MPKVKIKMSKWTIFGHISCNIELEGTVEELVEMKEKDLGTVTVR